MSKSSKNGAWMDERTRMLFESSGHLGPWTSREYERVFPNPVGEKVPDPAAQDRTVVAAATAEAEAQTAFDEADKAWASLRRQIARVQTENSRQIVTTLDGQMLVDSDLVREIDALKERERDLMRARENAGETLLRARTSYQRALADAKAKLARRSR